jgi:hypothetical protein
MKNKIIYYLTNEGEKVEAQLLTTSRCSNQIHLQETIKYKLGSKPWVTTSLRAFNETALRNEWVSITENDVRDFGL